MLKIVINEGRAKDSDEGSPLNQNKLKIALKSDSWLMTVQPRIKNRSTSAVEYVSSYKSAAKILPSKQ